MAKNKIERIDQEIAKLARNRGTTGKAERPGSAENRAENLEIVQMVRALRA